MITLSVLLNTFAQPATADPNRFNHFMILGYVVMWLIAMIYILTLANRQRNAREEIKLLTQLLSEEEEGTGE
jgi:hypothetical protein